MSGFAVEGDVLASGRAGKGAESFMAAKDVEEANTLVTDGTSSPTHFDYEALAPEDADVLRQRTSEIRGFYRNMVADALRTGTALREVKELLEHGQFQAWLTAEFSWNDRTAQRYMSAAKAFRDKTDTVSVLELTSVYRLAAPSTPAAVRDAIISELEAGRHVTTADITERIRSAVKQHNIDSARSDAKIGARPKRQREMREASRLAAETIVTALGGIDAPLRELLKPADGKQLLKALRADKRVRSEALK